MEEKKYIMLQDAVASYLHKNKRLVIKAKAHDIVTLVSDHDNMLIVMDKKGNRFPVKKSITREL